MRRFCSRLFFVLVASALPMFLLLSAATHARTYEIDPGFIDAVNDGNCSLFEALEAINTQSEVDGCLAGQGNDSLLFIEGESYDLGGKVMEIGAIDDLGTADVDEAVAVSVTLNVFREVFDDDPKENPILEQDGSDRLIYVHPGSGISIQNITLTGGNAVASLTKAGKGGLIYSQGSVTLSENAVLENGSATDGGALYVVGTNSVTISNTVFRNNQATNHGGAIFTPPDNTGIDIDDIWSGVISISRSTFHDNLAGANGGALYLDAASMVVFMSNTSFHNNEAQDGGAVRFNSPERVTEINNVTAAANISNAGAAFSYAGINSSPSSGEGPDLLLNTAVLGNTGADCASDGASPVDPFATIYSRYVYSNSGCPFNLGLGQTGVGFDVFVGEDIDGNDLVCGGATACLPKTFENGQSGFIPNTGSVISPVLNAGSPSSTTIDACESDDLRGLSRLDTCDIGAVELDIASGINDEIVVLVGVLSELDVLKNDVGEVSIDCNNLSAFSAVLPASAADPDTVVDIDDPSLDGCIVITSDPARGQVVSVNIDYLGYPTLNYLPNAGFRGIDTFRYQVPDLAFTGATESDRGASAQVDVVVEPASGFTEKEDIFDGANGVGSFNLYLILSAFLAGLIRKHKAVLVTASMLLVMANNASAATIVVNTTLDEVPSTTGDGLCTLREALGNAIDRNPIFSADCDSGATGRDTIELPGGIIRLVAPLEVTDSTVDIVGKGPGDGVSVIPPDSEPASTVIDGDTDDSGVGDVQLFIAESNLELRNMTLRNGNAGTGNGGAILAQFDLDLIQVELTGNTALNGGAIFLRANPDEERDVEFQRVYAHANNADNDGSVLATFGQNQAYNIGIENSSFVDNVAVGAGVLDLNLKSGGVGIMNSTFSANQAGVGLGSGVDLEESQVIINIMNSTFLNSGIGAVGALNMGPADNNTVSIYNTIYSNSGACSSDPTALISSATFNLFDVGRDVTCFTAADANEEEAAADIQTVLSGGTRTSAVFSDDLYIPDYFAIDDGASGNVAYADIVDAGNTADFFTSLNVPTNCRDIDVTNRSRLSGANRDANLGALTGCDLGAYELQVPTAVSDAGDNADRDDRDAVIDVLANDLAGEGNDLETDSVLLLPAPDLTVPVNGGSVAIVRSEDADPSVDCSVAHNAGDCVIEYLPPVNNIDCSLPEPEAWIDTFSYRFEVNGQTSTEAEVEVTLDNKRPTIESQVQVVDRGDTVVFPLVVDDVDGPVPASLADFELSREPGFALRDVNGTPDDVSDDVVLGFGVVIDLAAGTVTYTPADVSKAFADTFQIKVTDECGAEGTGTFRIEYNDDSNSGISGGSGGIGEGLTGSGWSLFMLLGLLRRKK